AVGLYESFLVKELIPFLKEVYKTDRIGIIGRSSGGFGALNIAMKGYDIKAIAVHSPDVYFEYIYLPILPIAYKELRKVKDVKEYINYFWSKEEKSKREMITMMIIGLSAFYSKSEEIELPFEMDTGGINNEVWENWIRKDPLRRPIEEFNNLRRLKMIYIDAGSKDEYNINIGVKIFHKKLNQLKIPHYYEEYNGKHNAPSRLNISLPLIENSLLE
ncbi:MAG: alpha/beta hydrolase-fold protein, partial [Sulfolobaceae archaeon]